MLKESDSTSERFAGIPSAQNIFKYHFKSDSNDEAVVARFRRHVQLVQTGLLGRITLSDNISELLSEFCKEYGHKIEVAFGRKFQPRSTFEKNHVKSDNATLIRLVWNEDQWQHLEPADRSTVKAARDQLVGHLKKHAEYNPEEERKEGYVDFRYADNQAERHLNQDRRVLRCDEPKSEATENDLFASMRNPEYKPPPPTFTKEHQYSYGEDLSDTTIYGKIGNVHLNFAALAWPYPPCSSDLWVAGLIIHESSHKWANTYDHTYTYEMEYTNLDKSQLVNNADSISYGCMSLFKNNLYRKYTDIRE